MKKLSATIIIFFTFCCRVFPAEACSNPLPIIYISAKSAVHLRSPEPISYVDLPSSRISGDLPLKNLLRLRILRQDSSVIYPRELGILTVTGEQFLAQYRIILIPSDAAQAHSEIEILPRDMLPLVPAVPSLSTPQIKAKAIEVITNKPNKSLATASNQGISIKVHQILCCGELIFLDLGFENATELEYQIDRISFTISDKKIMKATNFQQFPLELKQALHPLERFSKRGRNIYVLAKATFSSDKRLVIALSEKQPSSRLVSLSLAYRDILSADSF
ncbi:DUF4138 domain-containing protein [Pedobacter agri]|uniref:DUF4138 domain-containing protein n=1 Tax=Pedobacter agri TaxID=454586 RepID=UPI0029303069|nr:DUF4138 domain-containing protein [Pedobacter agri]